MNDADNAATALLRGAIDALTQGVIVLDGDHRVLHINPVAHDLTGRHSVDLVGQPWTALFNGPLEAEPAVLNIGGGPTIGVHNACRRRNGILENARVTFHVRPIAGAHDGTLITVNEMGSVAALEEQLHDSRRQLAITHDRGQVGFWEWDARTRTLTESGYWLGKTLNTANGAEVHDSVMLANTHPDDIQRVRAAMVAHMKGESEHYEVEQRVRLIDGGYIRFLVRGQAAECDAGGRVLRMVGTYVDITALREQEAVLKFALETSQQGIWEWDLDNDRIAELGYWQPQLDCYVLGNQIDSRTFAQFLHPDEVALIREQVLHHLRGDSATLEVEMRLKRGDGSWGEFLVRGQAIDRHADGRVGRILGAYTEISRLKTQERRLQVALENGRQGLWEWEPDEDRVFFSREWYAMFGHPPGSVKSHRIDTQLILHPDDIAPAHELLVAMLRGERDDFELEHRLRHANGHYINILARGRVVERDANSRATRVIGTHVDITELKQTEARLIESRQLLETVIDAFPQRVFWKDLNERYLGANRVFAKDAGFSTPAELVGKRLDEIAWPGPLQPLRDDDNRLVSGGETRVVTLRAFQPVASPALMVEVTKVPIRAPAGEIIGILGLYDDVSERILREQQMETVAAAFTRTEQSRLLDALTEAAAKLSGADYAFVSRFAHPTAKFARITACFPDTADLVDWHYELGKSPCYRAVQDGHYFVSEKVAGKFPQDSDLRAWGVEAYAGQRLVAADGATIGIFALLFKTPQIHESRIRAVIDIFAARATAELERELTLRILEASEQRLNAAIEGGSQGVWEWTEASDELQFFGRPFRDVAADVECFSMKTGAELFDVLHPDDYQRHRDTLLAYLKGQRATYEFEGRARHPDGSYRWILTRGQAASHDEHSRVTKLIGTLTDISAIKSIQSELESARQFLDLVINTVPQAIFWQDRNFRYRGCNQQFADLAGLADTHALLGLHDENLWWGPDAQRFHDGDRALLDGDVALLQQETKIHQPGKASAWFELIKVPMLDDAGKVIGLLGAVHDITKRKEAEQAAQHLAKFDPLTNLPNRRYFAERLESALAASRRRRNKGALLFIDMDQFKQVNDTLGHSVGDELLQAIAERLQNVTRQDDTVARLGGDEFVVLLPEIANDFEDCARQAQLVAEKIRASLALPFQLEHHQFHVTPTIGISLFPEVGKDVDDVLKEADTAMYSGKAAGRNAVRFFHPEMEEAARLRVAIESDLRRAIVSNEFELFFQPQVDRSRDVTGAEVLLRWWHPDRGLILPGEFIPVAEERGLIEDIGRWVLDASFHRFKSWIDDGLDIDELAINLSSRQFRSDDFVGNVEQLLALHRIPAHRVVFEITESTVIEDVEATIDIMTRLRRVGIRFAIDDFGVGYSSLSYLKRLPIDQLKIDRSFVADVGRDQNNEIICQTIIAMSQHLHLQTVAEGVESDEQYEFLSRLRCNRYQGYLFLPPSTEMEFLNYHLDA